MTRRPAPSGPGHHILGVIPLALTPLVLGSPRLPQPAFLIIATAVSVGIALVSWLLFEKQFLKVERLFPYQARERAERPRIVAGPLSLGVKGMTTGTRHERKAVVTAVIPSYATPEEYLRECLQSLGAQTFPYWDAIVVEDGPTGGQVERVVRSLSDPRVRVILHKRNRGMGAARNTACRAACTDLLVTLDADDRLAPDFLEKTIERLRRQPDADCVLVDFQAFGASRDLITIPVPLPPPCPQHPVFTDTGILMRRSLWEAVGGYTEDPSLRGVEWWDFWIKAVQVGLHLAHVAEPLYLYRRHAAGASVTTSMYDDHRNREALYRRHKAIFDAALKGNCLRCGAHSSIRAFKAQGYVVSSRAALAKGERLRGIRLALRGVWLYPWAGYTIQQLARSLVPDAAARVIVRWLRRRPAPAERPER